MFYVSTQSFICALQESSSQQAQPVCTISLIVFYCASFYNLLFAVYLSLVRPVLHRPKLFGLAKPVHFKQLNF